MMKTEIILIRHGQANTGAKDEESYDQLSDTGHQQAVHFAPIADVNKVFN